MKASKMTQGEKLYAGSNNIDFWVWMVEKKEAEKKAKAEKKAYWDAKYREAVANNPRPEVKEVVIAENAPRFIHGRFGEGVLVCEDQDTITLSFNGEVKQMVKAFTKLTKI